MNITQLRKSLAVGQNIGFEAAWCAPQLRKITEVNTTGFCATLVRNDGTVVNSWHRWEQASCYSFDGNVMTYTPPISVDHECRYTFWF